MKPITPDEAREQYGEWFLTFNQAKHWAAERINKNRPHKIKIIFPAAAGIFIGLTGEQATHYFSVFYAVDR